jgi:hypothetical protein
MNQLEKHEKAILILTNINDVTNRILRASKDVSLAKQNHYLGMKEHYENRILIDRKIKERLQNYYDKNFRL